MSNIVRLPGIIDIHVHLRDPGQTQKEDFYTGTCTALAGGVTAIFDMPNNLEPIFSSQKLEEKIEIARQKAVCDYGLYFGTDGENISQFKKVSDKVVGLKVYLSLTTGKYVIGDEELVEKVFREWPREKIIVVHAEGDRVDLAIRLAEKYNNKLHITHISTQESLEKIIEAKKNKLNITCDTAPHYLFLTTDDLSKLGNLGIVKPPLGSKKDKEFLWSNIDKIDCIVSDHAPHTLNDKEGKPTPAGLPGLETTLSLLLTAMNQDRLSLRDLIRLTNINPQKIFGYYQDKKTFVEVDNSEKYIIENKNLKTKCGWSPFNGWQMQGKVKAVYIRNIKVFENDKLLASPGFGKQVIS